MDGNETNLQWWLSRIIVPLLTSGGLFFYFVVERPDLPDDGVVNPRPDPPPDSEPDPPPDPSPNPFIPNGGSASWPSQYRIYGGSGSVFNHDLNHFCQRSTPALKPETVLCRGSQDCVKWTLDARDSEGNTVRVFCTGYPKRVQLVSN